MRQFEECFRPCHCLRIVFQFAVPKCGLGVSIRTVDDQGITLWLYRGLKSAPEGTALPSIGVHLYTLCRVLDSSNETFRHASV